MYVKFNANFFNRIAHSISKNLVSFKLAFGLTFLLYISCLNNNTQNVCCANILIQVVNDFELRNKKKILADVRSVIAL